MPSLLFIWLNTPAALPGSLPISEKIFAGNLRAEKLSFSSFSAPSFSGGMRKSHGKSPKNAANEHVRIFFQLPLSASN